MEVIVYSFLAVARPLLEYCIQFWSPECGRDIDKLEETEQGVPKLNLAGILAMRERVMELGFFRRDGFLQTWQQHPCTREQVFEKTDSFSSQRYGAGKWDTCHKLKQESFDIGKGFFTMSQLNTGAGCSELLGEHHPWNVSFLSGQSWEWPGQTQELHLHTAGGWTRGLLRSLPTCLFCASMTPWQWVSKHHLILFLMLLYGSLVLL